MAADPATWPVKVALLLSPAGTRSPSTTPPDAIDVGRIARRKARHRHNAAAAVGFRFHPHQGRPRRVYRFDLRPRGQAARLRRQGRDSYQGVPVKEIGGVGADVNL